MSNPSRPEIKTIANLESAFAGESMAHIKYRYFAKLAREMGDEVTARAFEETAAQEVMHAFGHLDLLYPKASMTPAKALQIAIDGETYEYTEMYPSFRKTAEAEGNSADMPCDCLAPHRRNSSSTTSLPPTQGLRRPTNETRRCLASVK